VQGERAPSADRVDTTYTGTSENYKRSGVWFRNVERDFVYVVAKVAGK